MKVVKINEENTPDYEKLHPAKNAVELAKEAVMEGKVVVVTQGENPNPELGISEITKLIKAIKEIEEAYGIVMEDGKVTIGDFISHPTEVIWQPVTAIYDVIKTKELLVAQAIRLDDSEAQEIIAEVARQFNMVPEKMMKKIGHVIKAVYHISEIFKS